MTADPNKKIIPSMFTILIVSWLAITPLFAQRSLISEKYLFIQPGKFTRNDVEKMLGQKAGNRAVLYSTEEAVIRVEYSPGNCDLSAWDLPTGTVEEVFFALNDEKRIRLKDVILDLSKFKKRQAGDVLEHVKYYNEAAGISVIYDKFTKSVIDIIISLTSEQKKRYRCK